MSQDSLNVPTLGPVTPTDFAGDINNALDAVISKNSGASQPTNFPTVGLGSEPGQDWLDTTTPAFPVWKLFDGSAWPRVGTQDTASGVFCPKQGGGSGSIASAATTNIFALPYTFVSITGVVAITSFGSAGEVGEWKWLTSVASFTITSNANITCPNSVDIVTAAGDIFKLINIGGGVTVADYQRASSEGTFVPTVAFDGLSTGVTYSTQVGTYSKIGRTVHFNIQIILTSAGSDSGQFTVEGLPFTSGSGPAPVSLWLDNWATTSNPIVQAFVDVPSTHILFYVFDGDQGDTVIDDGNITNTAKIFISGTYFTA